MIVMPGLTMRLVAGKVVDVPPSALVTVTTTTTGTVPVTGATVTGTERLPAAGVTVPKVMSVEFVVTTGPEVAVMPGPEIFTVVAVAAALIALGLSVSGPGAAVTFKVAPV